MRFRLLAVLAALLPAACGAPPAAVNPLAHLPPFARVPYAPFSRADAIAIATAEWHAWGDRVDDSDPRLPEPPAVDKPERDPGFWQRVGLYWYIGQDAGREESAWTGEHDARGAVFPPQNDAAFAWSAAFISYVMRMAGSGTRFPAAPDHAAYINAARRMSLGETSGLAITAEDPARYAPVAGDLICTGRAGARGISFAELPAPRFPSHCAIVAGGVPGMLSVIGGNVGDAVALTHVPITAQGLLDDPHYPWFVVIRVLYDQ